MTAQLDHTVVWCRDKAKSSAFLSGILGLPSPKPFARFLVVELGNGVSLDFADREEGTAPVFGHYAFLVSDAEFDAGFDRVKQAGLTWWADPARSQPGEINHHWGGRGFYFEDPDGNLLELITRKYGSEDDL